MTNENQIRAELSAINSAVGRILNTTGGVIECGQKTMGIVSVQNIKSDAHIIKSAIQALARNTGVEY